MLLLCLVVVVVPLAMGLPLRLEFFLPRGMAREAGGIRSAVAPCCCCCCCCCCSCCCCCCVRWAFFASGREGESMWMDDADILECREESLMK